MTPTATATKPKAAQAPAYNLSTDAILMRVIIGRAGTKAKSRTLQEEAAETHGADVDSLDMKVSVIARKALDKIVRAESMARAAFYFASVRWDDKAYRLVPVGKVPGLQAELASWKDVFMDGVEELAASRNALAKDYVQRVGAQLAKENPFPTEQELRKHYRFEVRMMPIANGSDIRLRMVDESVVEAIRADVTAVYAERLEQAQMELVQRLQERVAAVHAALKRDGGKLHGALTENLEKELAALPGLNITGNPRIDQLIQKTKQLLGGLDFDDVKADDDSKKPTLRKATVKAASTVLDDLKNFGL